MCNRAGAAFIISAVLVFIPAGAFSVPPPRAQLAPRSTQTDRFLTKLLQNRYALAVRRGQLTGGGAQVLQTAIAQSRFVQVGEYHGIAQTSEFVTAVCHAAGPQ